MCLSAAQHLNSNARVLDTYTSNLPSAKSIHVRLVKCVYLCVCDASASIVVMPAYVADLFYAIYGLSLAGVLHGMVVCCKQHSAVDYAHFVQHNLSASLWHSRIHAADRARMQHYMMHASTCPGYVQPPWLRDRSALARLFVDARLQPHRHWHRM